MIKGAKRVKKAMPAMGRGKKKVASREVPRKTIIGFEAKNAILWKQDKLAFAEIESQDLSNVDYDASRLDFLTISTSNIRDSGFHGLKGGLDLGVGFARSNLLRCTFSNCLIKRLSFGFVYLEECEFKKCDIRELWSFDADLKDCKFSGYIRNGAFNISIESQKFPHEARVFSGNDFTECVIAMNIFRGGIDLADQRFNKKDGSLVINDVGAFLIALRAKLDPRKPDLDLERFASQLEFTSTRFLQPSVFVSGKSLEALGSGRDLLFETIRDRQRA
jgi:uncharacterized protein YjbI with pentapeptide repeats